MVFTETTRVGVLERCSQNIVSFFILKNFTVNIFSAPIVCLFLEVAEKLQFLVTQEKLETEWDPDDRIELNEPINFGRVWMLLASVESKLGHLTTAQR